MSEIKEHSDLTEKRRDHNYLNIYREGQDNWTQVKHMRVTTVKGNQARKHKSK